MHGVCLDFPLSSWFDFKTPTPSISPRYIEKSISEVPDLNSRPNAIVLWLGSLPEMAVFEERRGKKIYEIAELVFFNKKKEWAIETEVEIAEWLVAIFPELLISNADPYSFENFKADFEKTGISTFEVFSKSATWLQLRESGLLVV